MEKQTAGMYLHIPFCLSKCSYCSFVSLPIAGRDDGRMARYAQRLHQQMVQERPHWEGVTFDSLYIGGGTPSLLPAEAIPKLIRRALTTYEFTANPEITIELNPESFTPHKAYAWAQAGVNRLSMGVQSTQPEFLRLLGRPHTFDDALNALDYARMAGIDNVNMDLMVHLPGQTVAQAEAEAQAMLGTGIPHLSAYALTLEEGTPLWDQVRRGELPGQEEDAGADMWLAVGEVCAAAGLARYEISNYAKPGHLSRQNLHYWRQHPYAGFGVAAHGARAQGEALLRCANGEDVAAYLEGQGTQRCERVAGEALAFEHLMLGTRLCEGIELSEFERRFGVPLTKRYGEAAARAVEAGLASLTPTHFALTPRGMLVQNAILQWFMSGADD